MQFIHITLFPEWVQQASELGVTGRAIQNGQVGWHTINPRDFSDHDYGQIDDAPFGGGPGMVMQYAPLKKAILAAQAQYQTQVQKTAAALPVVYLSPQGQRFDQAMAARFAEKPGLILLSGRYEGVDERLLAEHVDQEVSLGDFVLSGGEPAALAVADATIRLLPGVLGSQASLDNESFNQGRLDYPQYTRPAKIDDLAVPEVLLSGDHQAIADWRDLQQLQRTQQRRPELIDHHPVTERERTLLERQAKNKS